MRIPERVHFVVPNREKWGDLFSGALPEVSSLADRIIANVEIWCVQGYLQLVKRGLEASIGDAPIPETMNVVDAMCFGSRYFSSDIFVIGCRGDGPYPGFCHVVLQQNSIAMDKEPAWYLPQWPQPGLVPRDPSRRGIATVGFLGDAKKNLAAPFKDPAFATDLRALGADFVVRGKEPDRVRWHDCSDLDLILAVRDIPASHLLLKPGNKLSNAWLADVPALLGPEPAFQEMRRGELDYVEVRTPEEALSAVRRLKSDPMLYARMVENGRRRGTEFDEEAVARRWFEALERAVHEFEAWKGRGFVSRRTDFLKRVLRHRLAKVRHRRRVLKGYRRGAEDRSKTSR